MEKPGTDVTKRGFVAVMKWTAVSVVRTTVTLGVIAGAVFAIQYGATELAQRAEAAPIPDPAPAIPVTATPLNRELGYDVQRAFIGQVEAAKTVNVSFELSGRLQDIMVDEGDTVVSGQVLATQDTSLLDAERTQLLASKSATEAQLKFANQTVDRNEELMRRGFATQAVVDEALARRDELLGRIAEIEASLSNVDIRLEKSRLVAPFDGRVTARNVDGGETLGTGQSIIGLVELSAPQVRVGVPLEFDADELSDARIVIDGKTVPV
ncbi:MAG: efflux RND transporter periplasmic adaptor subunit, partial [Pseudomonadota bacterium]